LAGAPNPPEKTRPIHILLSYDEETTCLGVVDAIVRMGIEAPRPGAEAVTWFPDDDQKYLSTDLFGEEPVLPRYMAPGIRLLGYDAALSL